MWSDSACDSILMNALGLTGVTGLTAGYPTLSSWAEEKGGGGGEELGVKKHPLSPFTIQVKITCTDHNS